MHIDLSGKRVIVTGASRGIGAAVAKGFAREGARLAICARNDAAIDAIGREARVLGAQNVVASSIDVRDTEQVRGWIEERGGPAIEAARPEQIEMVGGN